MNSPLTFGNKKRTLLLAKTNQMMKDAIIQYLSEGFGSAEGGESIKLPRSMPLVISSGYRFCKCRILGVECILAMAAESAVHTPRRVQKQLALVEAEMKKPVVFATRRLQPHDKARYVALRVPLVVPSKVAYLPFAGAMQDTSRREFVVNSLTFSAVAQQVVLAFLEHRLAAPSRTRFGSLSISASGKGSNASHRAHLSSCSRRQGAGCGRKPGHF